MEDQKAVLLRRFTANSVLDDALELSLAKVTERMSVRPAPVKFRSEELEKLEENDAKAQKSDSDELMPSEDLVTMDDFERWYEEVLKVEESVLESEEDTELEPISYSHLMKITGKEILETTAVVEDWRDSVKSICRECGMVEESVAEIYATAQKKTDTIEYSEKLAAELEARMWYFDQLYPLQIALQNPAQLITNTFSVESFTKTLTDLDKCIAFLTEERKTFKEAEAYLAKYTALQSKAYTAIKTHIVDTLRNSGLYIAHSVAQNSTALNTKQRGAVLLSPESLDSNQIFLQFRLLSQKLSFFCRKLEDKMLEEELKDVKVPLFRNLMSECMSCYFTQRKSLISPSIAYTMSYLVQNGCFPDCVAPPENERLNSIVRYSCLFTTKLCRFESNMISMFFRKDDDMCMKTATNIVQFISDALVFGLRPMIIHESSLDVLCSVASILKDGSSFLDFNTEPDEFFKQCTAPFVAATNILLKDAQGRITFLAQKYIKNNVVGYVSTPDDIAYPDKLTKEGASDNIEEIYKTWYPTVQNTLLMLSKLYLVVETPVFETIAANSVEACLHTLDKAYAMMKEKCAAKYRETHKEGEIPVIALIDAELFLIRHYLTLREQLSPFDVSYELTSFKLDFGPMKAKFKGIFSSIGSFARFFTSLQNFSPAVEMDTSDSRKKLEDDFNMAYERFVVSFSKELILPLFSFILQFNSWEQVFTNKNGEDKDAMFAELAKQPWASQEALQSIAKEVTDIMKAQIPELSSKLQTYLGKEQGRGLVEPIQDNILSSWEQFHYIYKQLFPEGDAFTNVVDISNLMVEHSGGFIEDP